MAEVARPAPAVSKSEELFREAQSVLPGGVNSPVRSFRAVGGVPRFIARAEGATMTDVDGNRYLDYVGSWGPLILGHAHPRVVEAISAAARAGTSFGAPSPREVALARAIVAAVPSIELVRMVNSGTEAVMSAIRLARAYTGRDKVVKFAGCYHGHSDFLLVKAGSGAATLGIPDSPGVPEAAARDTITVPFNDPEAVAAVFDAEGDRIACVIVEPVAGNMGVVPPREEFLGRLRELTAAHGALLIFDEVITGFRVAYGGAQARYGVLPDLTCLGKIIGGGLPVGAYGGRREIMSRMAPLGPVYQAGTLSGNPLAMAAGLETLAILAEPGVYTEVEAKAAALAEGLEGAARRAGVPVVVQRVASMLTVFFTDSPVHGWDGAARCDTRAYARFFHALLEQGVYFPPAQFEAAFVSTAHTGRDIDQTINAAERAFKAVAGRS